MAATECSREGELLEALQTSAWPDCCPADLRTHVEACDSCADLVAVVLPLLDEHRAAALDANVPTSAVVWWRAQMRARQEAAARAMRPITIVQGLSLACAAGLLAGAASLVSPAFRQWMSWAAGAVADLGAVKASTLEWPDVSALTTPFGIAALLALMTVAVLTPVAIYLAGGDD